MNDLKFAIRMLFRKPAGVLIIIATLALLIGGAGLALGFIQHEVSAWNPFPKSNKMVRLWRLDRERPEDDFPAGIYADLKKEIKGLEHIAAIRYANPQIMTGVGQPSRITPWQVSAAAFDITGISPQLGRVFTAEEEHSGSVSPIVLSNELWEEKFASKPDVLGQSITLDGKPHTIIGVMPAGLERNALFYACDAWLPGNFESTAKPRQRVTIVGRLKHGTSLKQLHAEISTVTPPIEKAFNDAWDYSAGIAKAQPFSISKDFQKIEVPMAIIATAIPLFVLLIACFNIANILLARMLGRRKEFAVRSSLGAARPRLIRQLLIESVVIAVAGAFAGMLCGGWIANLGEAKGFPIEFSHNVFLAMFALAIVIGLFSGWIPSLRATGGDLNGALKSGESGSRENRRFRGFLVMGQVAMATALCISAGLLVRSYTNRKNFDPGFDVSHMLTASVYHSGKKAYEKSDARRLWTQQTEDLIAEIPGVEEVAISSTRPVERWPISLGFRHASDPDTKRNERIRVTTVSPNYFDMVNVPILRGRGIEDSDRVTDESVALINQRFAQMHFPGQDPVGKQIHLNIEGNPNLTIIGIVPDRRNLGRRENLGAELYLSTVQYSPKWASTSFLIKTRAEPSQFSDAVHGAMRSVDPALPVNRPRTLQRRIDSAVSRDIEGLYAVAGISAFGLLMAVLGIYGIISHFVVARTREVGVRMALGASRAAVRNLILRQGMKLVIAGLISGAFMAGGITIGLQELLYGVQSFDPATYSTVAAAIALTALIAAIFPARKAAQVQPMEALRHD